MGGSFPGEMKTIVYLLLGFSALHQLPVLLMPRKIIPKLDRLGYQQVENQAKDKKITEKQRYWVFLIMEVIIVYKESMRKS